MSRYIELVYCTNCEELFDGCEYDGDALPDCVCNHCGEVEAWDVRRYNTDELEYSGDDGDEDDDACPECGEELWDDDCGDNDALYCDACGWES